MTVTTEVQIAVTERERDPGLVLASASTQDAADRESIAEETHVKEDLIHVIATEIEEIVIEEIVSLGVGETKTAPRDLKKAALK